MSGDRELLFVLEGLPVFKGERLLAKSGVVHYCDEMDVGGKAVRQSYSRSDAYSGILRLDDLCWPDPVGKPSDPEVLHKGQSTPRKHSHYFKDVSSLDVIDVYRVCELFGVDDPSGATQHAVKKLLCAGQRGAKDRTKDYQEAIDTLTRRIEMMRGDDARP